jgi:Ras-related protein Rab-8A
VIPTEKGQELANKMGLKFFETSAKDGDGVLELFQSLARDIQRKIEEGPKSQSQTVTISSPQGQQSSDNSDKCCGSH